MNVHHDQSKSPPIPSSSYSTFGSGAFGASFLVYLTAGLVSAFFSATGADDDANNSNSLILYPDSNERAAMFLNELAKMRGMVASIGYPASNERPAKFLIPLWKEVNNEAGSMLITSCGRMAPLS